MNTPVTPTLKVAEMFYSVQGEGPTTGKPSIFLRLAGCNLMCGGPGGRFLREGRATWWCDTETVWREGEDIPVQYLLEKCCVLAPGINTELRNTVSLVITGGEPTLPNHLEGLLCLTRVVENTWTAPFMELETNGTGADWSPELYARFGQINCSPKLSNSGMRKDFRYCPTVLSMFATMPRAIFKFVVSTPEDLAEVQRDFLDVFNPDPSRVYLMPGVDNLANLSERTRFVFDAAKFLRVRACTRAHVLAWDRVTGV